MKKLFAFLLACMMLLSVTTAVAEGVVSEYDPVSLNDSTLNILPVYHTLSLVDGATELPCDVTYTFEVREFAIVAPEGITAANYTNMIEGAPTITEDITYTNADFENGTTSKKQLKIDWSGVKVKEPGVYRWVINKQMEIDPTVVQKPSDENKTAYLFVSVTDVNGSLNVVSANLATNAELKDKVGYNDTYPAQQIGLNIKKEVTGSQGSKSQYFKFNVQLKLPDSAKVEDIEISNIQQNVPATAYHGTQVNDLEFTKVTGSDYNYQATIWLKHGDEVKITGLPYGASYNITEDDDTCSGYDVATKVTGDTEGANESDYTVTDGKLTGTTTVSFINDKNPEVPTGIDLQTGAPIMGLLMAASMLLMLFIGKRKEAAE